MISPLSASNILWLRNSVQSANKNIARHSSMQDHGRRLDMAIFLLRSIKLADCNHAYWV